MGEYYDSGDARNEPLILHWDGSSWSQVTPFSFSYQGYLYGVTVVSSSQAWAVGKYVNSGNKPLILK